MHVKFKEPRKGRNGKKNRVVDDVVELADYEGRRLIEQGVAEPVPIDPLDHDGNGRKGGMRGAASRSPEVTTPEE